MSPAELSSVDVVRMNLIVAKEVDPDIDIPAFERLVGAIAAHVRRQIEINEPFFEREKAIFGGCREKWIVALMWSVFTEDLGSVTSRARTTRWTTPGHGRSSFTVR